MRPTDISFAVRLTNLEGWGIPATDFARILRLDGRGSFVATEGRRRVGLATATHYGRRIGWIGNVVVNRRYRGRHIGQRLVMRAVNYLSEARVKHVVLYCFEENVRFYRKLGFIEGPRFVRLRRESEPRLPSLEFEESFRPLAPSSLFAMDRKAFGADRSRLLAALLSEGFAWYLGYRAGSSASYVLVKNYDDMNEIGPWVSLGLNSRQLDLLLRRVIRRSGRKPIEVTCPLTGSSAVRIMRKRGFHSINRGRVMFFKRIVRVGRPRAIVAYGFLDKG